MLLSLQSIMKKAVVSISFLLYFAVTSGIVINSHYCMKKLVSVHFFETEAEVCGKCGMDTHESSGCCRNEVKVLKLVQDQNRLIIESLHIPALETPVITPSDFIVALFENTNRQLHFHNHSPPLISEQDTYLQNNVFRI